MKQKTKRKPVKQTRRPATKKAAARSRAVAKKPVQRRISRNLKVSLAMQAGHDYKLRFIRRYGLIAVMVVVIAVQCFFFMFQDGRILGDENNLTIAQLLTDTNKQRTGNSLEPLKLNDKLSAAAKAKADDMIATGYWAHDAPNGTTPWEWIDGAGYKYSYAGENLARGFNTSTGVIDAWMESPTHRSNVLGSEYTDVGFAAVNGVMDGKSTTLIVAMYGRPVGAPMAGDIGETHTLASQTKDQVPLLTRIKRGIESNAPTLIISLVVLTLAACTAIATHIYRQRSPKHRNKGGLLYRHQGLYKVALAIITAIGSIFSYGGGMI